MESESQTQQDVEQPQTTTTTTTTTSRSTYQSNQSTRPKYCFTIISGICSIGTSSRSI